MEVGAMMVGKIVNDSNEMNVSRGQEKGHFEFGGSTIILLTKKNKIKPVASLISNTLAGYETIIKQGEVLAIKAQI